MARRSSKPKRAPQKAAQVYAGRDVTVRRIGDDTMVGFGGARPSFASDFKCELVGSTAVRIRPGTVNTIPAKLDGKTLDENPKLTFGRLDLDDSGRGYIVAEVKFAAKDWAVESVTPRQVARIDPDAASAAGGAASLGAVPILSGRIARLPLAMLRRRKTGRLVLFQIARFSYQCRVDVRRNSDGSSAETGRAFFWPA